MWGKPRRCWGLLIMFNKRKDSDCYLLMSSFRRDVKTPVSMTILKFYHQLRSSSDLVSSNWWSYTNKDLAQALVAQRKTSLWGEEAWVCAPVFPTLALWSSASFPVCSPPRTRKTTTNESSCLPMIYCIFSSFSWFFWLEEICTVCGWYTTLSFWTWNSSCRDYYGIFLCRFVSYCCHLAPLRQLFWPSTHFSVLSFIFFCSTDVLTCELKVIGLYICRSMVKTRREPHPETLSRTVFWRRVR